MSRFTVIGLGKFGQTAARTLFDKGHEVLGIDSDAARVQQARDFCTKAAVADGHDPETLRALGVELSDAVVVSLGERMDASVLVTLYLKEMGVRNIVVKALSEDHQKVLSLVGATEIVHPERDTAVRVGNALGARSILEYLPLGVGFSLVELAAPPAFVDRTLGDLQVRARYRVLVVAVKNGQRLEFVPGADYRIQTGDILVVIGKNDDLAELTRSVS